MKGLGLLAICGLALAGCSSKYLAFHSSSEWNHKVSPDVMEAWRQHGSYYALVEIVDTYVNPWCNPATKEQVRRVLGPGDEGPDGYPGADADHCVYASYRKVPYGSYCIISFGKDGKVSDVDWVSE